jgi:hypothetical protein
MGIKRCPLHRLPDVTWEVADYQASAVHFTYDIRGIGVRLARRRVQLYLLGQDCNPAAD